MYRHILLPTDGSALSREAVAGGIALARRGGAAGLGWQVVALPAEALLAVDDAAHCDLIYMASHGWQGEGGRVAGQRDARGLASQPGAGAHP